MALGYLEMVVKATDADGNETMMTTTPSMWMVADEWADRFRAKGHHTEAWVLTKMEQGIWYMACVDNGLMPDEPLSLPAIGEMWNRYQLEQVEAYEPEAGAEDPS